MGGKEALTRFVELDRLRYELTLEALDDVEKGRLVDHRKVEAWAAAVGAGRRRK